MNRSVQQSKERDTYAQAHSRLRDLSGVPADAGRRGARPQLVELTGPVTRLEVAVRDLERDVAALAEQREWTA